MSDRYTVEQSFDGEWRCTYAVMHGLQLIADVLGVSAQTLLRDGLIECIDRRKGK